MLDLIEISKEVYEVSQRLEKASKNLYKLAKEKAESERDYRMNLAKEIVRLREEKVPATLIPDLARGNISELRFKRDLAADMYRAAVESLEAIKSQLSALQSILKYHEHI
ncbi:hypothetical protein BSNK01_12210 [Bacillaceae bacterium]